MIGGRTGLVCLLGALLALLGAYVALVITGHTQAANGLFPAVLSLLVGSGVIGHVEARTRQQNVAIAKIDAQTNGVLTQRIEDGATRAVEAVLGRAGLLPLAAPAVSPVVAVPAATGGK